MTYETKTKETDADVAAFIDAVPDERKRADAVLLVDLFSAMTGDPPKMWGPSIIGFGSYHYKYESGHEGDMARAGFSPRKANIVIYLTSGYENPETGKIMTDLRARLGKHKIGKSCLYINKLSDVDIDVLGEMVRVNGIYMDEKYPR